MRPCLTPERHPSSLSPPVFLAGLAPFPQDTACALAVRFQFAIVPVQSSASGPSSSFRVVQACLSDFLEPQRPCAGLLVTHIVFECHFPVILPAFQTLLSYLYPFLLGRAPGCSCSGAFAHLPFPLTAQNVNDIGGYGDQSRSTALDWD